MSQVYGTAATPIRHGMMRLVIPNDSPCHPVVGGTYQQRRDRQIAVATEIVSGTFVQPEIDASLISQTNHGSKRDGQAPMLVRILQIFLTGKEVVSALWSMDIPAIGNLAIASKDCSEAIAMYISRFHLPSGDFQGCDLYPSSLDKMAADRKVNIGICSHLLIRGKEKYPAATTIKEPYSIWASPTRRDEKWLTNQSNKDDESTYFKECLPYTMSEINLSIKEGKLMDAFKNYGIAPHRRAISHNLLRETSYDIPMLRALSQFGGNLKNISLHKVPMLDIKVVNLMLSICPSLETMSLFECDLLHFNSIIPLLDAIHWSSKKMKKTPVQLDFRPMTYFGSPSLGQGTHIISWNGLEIRALGPSVFTTILLAVLKALPMGIDLLGQDKLLRKFLDMIPIKPGAGTVFVHHLCLYVDSLKDLAMPEEAREALENQVLLSIYNGTNKKHSYKDRHSLFQSYDCCRCGSTMIRGLFDQAQTARPNDQRVCRVCILDYELEGQDHHRLMDKRLLLNTLFHNNEAIERAPLSDDPTIQEEDLANIKAPIMENRFVSGPAPDSSHRHAALMEKFNLPAVKDLIAKDHEINILCAAGDAAWLDLDNKILELKGKNPDFGQRGRNPARYSEQTWEQVLADQWEMERAKKENRKPAGFW